MEDQFQDSIIFALHIGLLASKLIAIFILTKMFVIKKALDNNAFIFYGKIWFIILLLFTISVSAGEIWILANYYLVSSNFNYEVMSMLDQFILTIVLVLAYKGGNTNGS